MAVLALVGIDNRPEKTEPAEEAKGGAYRADGIAPCASVLPGKNRNNNEGGCGDGGNYPANGLTAGAGNHLAKETIRVKQYDKVAQACYDACHKNHKYYVADFLFLGRFILFLLTMPQSAYNVLQYAKRADNRTVDAAKEQCQQYQYANDDKVKCQNGRQELPFGQEAKL